MKRFLLTAVLAFIATYVFAQERIAVFPFEDIDNVLTRNEMVMFYREFSIEFANRSANRFSVVPRQEVERLINIEMDFQLSVFSAQEKTAEMNRVLNGTQILSGLIGRWGNNIRISVSLYTYPELVQLPGGAVLSVSNKNELINKIPELVQSMQNEIINSTAQQIPEGLIYENIEGRALTITKYTGNATTLNIPSHINGLPVTSIGEWAFGNCRSLTSVTIPSSVRSIGERAFYDCNSLTSVTIPSSVTSIGAGAFGWCNSLTSVTIPSSVRSIGEWAFYVCSSLTNITIPSSVTSIGNYAFSSCSSLTSITVDNRNPNYASVDGVLFDKNIRTIITYPAGKTARTYTIPSSVTSIGIGAFSGSGLTSVSIPSSVTSIGDGAFSGCRSLTSITIDNRNTVYASVDGVLFDKNIRTLILYPEGKNQRTYIIPSSVTSIGDFAFSSCRSLTSITIPSSVTSIGDGAFGDCSNLTSVTIPSSVTSIGNHAFSFCRSLTNITIPSSVTSIGNYAFMSCGITSVTLSRRTQVGEDAFDEWVQIIYRD